MALNVVERLGSVFRGADLEANLSVLAINMAAKVCKGHSAPVPFLLPGWPIMLCGDWGYAVPCLCRRVAPAKTRMRFLRACSNMTGPG